MKISSDICINSLAGMKIVHRSNLSGVGKTTIISLNPSSEWLLENLRSREFSEEDAVQALLSHYEVDEDTARRDVAQWIEKLRKGGIIE